ncbi:MAG: ATP-binding cassette domain-containing protein [Dongiaceae bacterium]
MSNAVIEASGLTKRYGPRVAVDHIDLAIVEGEVFGLLGPNGAGKTTTILMIMGLTDVSEERCAEVVPDRRASRLAWSAQHRLACADSVGFYDNLTAREVT